MVPDCRFERRSAFRCGNQRAGNFRNCAGRVVVEQPLFAAGRSAQRGATGELRNRCGNGDCGRAAARGNAIHARNYSGAERLRHVVCLRRAGGIFYLHCGVHRGNQSRAFRFAGSGIGTGRRLHDGIQRLPLGALFPRGIHQHGRRRVDRHNAISWRMAAPVCRNAGFQFSRLGAVGADAGRWRILFLSRAEAAGKSAESFYGGRGAAHVFGRDHSRGAAGSCRRQFASRFEAGIARGFLVPVESGAVHLFVHVAAVYVPALPVRSVDAPGLAIFDSAVDRQRDGDRRGPRAAPALGMGASAGVRPDDVTDTVGSRMAGLGRREEGQRARVRGGA